MGLPEGVATHEADIVSGRSSVILSMFSGANFHIEEVFLLGRDIDESGGEPI